MPSQFLSLRRDEQGRIAERTLNLGGEAEIRRYAYDSAGRLARVADGSGGLLESCQYEPSGLLLRVDLPDGRRIDYAYDARHRRQARADALSLDTSAWRAVEPACATAKGSVDFRSGSGGLWANILRHHYALPH